MWIFRNYWSRPFHSKSMIFFLKKTYYYVKLSMDTDIIQIVNSIAGIYIEKLFYFQEKLHWKSICIYFNRKPNKMKKWKQNIFVVYFVEFFIIFENFKNHRTCLNFHPWLDKTSEILFEERKITFWIDYEIRWFYSIFNEYTMVSSHEIFFLEIDYMHTMTYGIHFTLHIISISDYEESPTVYTSMTFYMSTYKCHL